MRFTINLATKRVLDLRLFNRICAGTIALLLLLLCWNIFRFLWNMGESHRLTVEITASEKKLKSLPVAVVDKDSAKTRATIVFYNEIITRRSFPWLAFLEQLEIVTPEGVALTGVTPERESGTVQIEGLARDFGKVRAYLESLEESPYFQSIQLVSHQNVVLWEQAKGVRFSVMCRVKFQ
jgi:Tfp pilus assembly protein PilN